MGFDWEIFFKYAWPPTAFQNPLIVTGLQATLVISIGAQLLGVVLGLVFALAQMSKFRAFRMIAQFYITYFRGTPALVQLSLIYFGLAAMHVYDFPDLILHGFRFRGIIQAAILGLGVSEGAYMTEIIRAGIISVHSSQMEAAKSLGMTYALGMRRIVLPQALRVIIPPTGNEFNNMFKASTLTVNIGAIELFNAFEQINAVYFQPFELFLAASVYYLAITITWGFVQSWLEKRFGDKVAAHKEPGLLSRLLKGGISLRRKGVGKYEG